MADSKAQTVESFGPNNASFTMEGDDIVIRVNSKGMAVNTDGSPKLVGTPNKDKQPRKTNLVATSGGFKGVGMCNVSLNVTS